MILLKIIGCKIILSVLTNILLIVNYKILLDGFEEYIKEILVKHHQFPRLLPKYPWIRDLENLRFALMKMKG